MQAIKQFLKDKLTPEQYIFYYIQRRYPRDWWHVLKFLFQGRGQQHSFPLSFAERLFLVRRMYATSLAVNCPHAQQHIFDVLEALFNGPEGCLVEAGSFKGGSTAKFSLAVKMLNRKLYAFDSFEGIPPNEEDHEVDIYGRHVGGFKAGSYQGTLAEVKQNVAQYGDLTVCEFIKGWFDETMPNFSEKVAVAYIDVDLASSTRTCLKYLYPLLMPGGALFSQDGHLPLVVEALDDDTFWEQEVGVAKPPMTGLHESIMVKITKPTVT